jgi:hypothetical protein
MKRGDPGELNCILCGIETSASPCVWDGNDWRRLCRVCAVETDICRDGHKLTKHGVTLAYNFTMPRHLYVEAGGRWPDGGPLA